MKLCEQCGCEFRPNRREQVYCSKSCAGVRKGAMSSSWMKGRTNRYRGAKQIDADGYVRICGTNHPYRGDRRMLLEHVAVMEIHIGRRLRRWENVHHVNGDRQDNRLENLQLMSHSEHSSMHAKDAVAKKKRDARGRFCA